MGKHAKIPVPGEIAERVKRTAFAVGASTLLLLGVIPTVLQIIVDELGAHLPEGLRLWLLGAAVVVTAASTAVTRIMAIPAVNAWLSAHTPFGTERPARAREIVD